MKIKVIPLLLITFLIAAILIGIKIMSDKSHNVSPQQTKTPGSVPPPDATTTPAGKDNVSEGNVSANPGKALIKLSDMLENVLPAYSGNYLALKYISLSKVDIINIQKGKIEKEIELPGKNALIAAGGNVLLAYLPDTDTFKTWNLDTFEPIGTKSFVINGRITVMEMGINNSRTAVISYADSMESLSRRHYALLDVDTFTVKEFIDNPRFNNTSFRDKVHIRVSPMGNAFTSWDSSSSPSGFSYVVIGDGPRADVFYEHESFGVLTIGNSGRRIYGSGGHEISLQGKVLNTFPDNQLYAAIGGDYFIRVFSENIVYIHREDFPNAVGRFDLPFKMPRYNYNEKLAPDRKIFLFTQIGYAVLVDNDKLEITILEIRL